MHRSFRVPTGSDVRIFFLLPGRANPPISFGFETVSANVTICTSLGLDRNLEGAFSTGTQLRALVEYTQSIVDTMRDPMLVLDARLRVHMASRSYYEMFQVTREETEGRLIYSLGNGQWNIPALRLLLESILPAQSSFDDFAIDHEFPLAGHRSLLLNARKLWRESNHTELILLSIEDVTERKKSADSIAAANKEVQRSNEDLERFAYTASHDLKAPLRTMIAFSEILLNTPRNDEDRKLLEHIRKAGQQATALVENLLRLAAVGRQQIFSHEPVFVSEACSNAIGNLRSELDGSGACITTNIPPDATVRIENTFLTQVFQNLIQNAILYRKEEIAPHIEVTAKACGNEWICSVRDNGIGIDADHTEIIFQAFRRLHGSDRPGSGIGLSTCQRIIERAQGRIWVDSHVGHGATFFFALTMAADPVCP